MIFSIARSIITVICRDLLLPLLPQSASPHYHGLHREVQHRDILSIVIFSIARFSIVTFSITMASISLICNREIQHRSCLNQLPLITMASSRCLPSQRHPPRCDQVPRCNVSDLSTPGASSARPHTRSCKSLHSNVTKPCSFPQLHQSRRLLAGTGIEGEPSRAGPGASEGEGKEAREKKKKKERT